MSDPITRPAVAAPRDGADAPATDKRRDGATEPGIGRLGDRKKARRSWTRWPRPAPTRAA
ncbi:hypothetical protein [Micromonospora viridifaciens]|uniref:hypothetical protein n=1 Tax=Micromonospora viridifaciens TaxID=1881 RepID=UPI00142E3ED9|nr:hypothetical protein [Micromonospora viridifaciens]